MHRIHSIRPTQSILAGVLIGMMLLITACGGSPQSQAQQLSTTGAPFTLFNDQPVTDYNTNLASHYQQLEVQTEGVISSISDQYSIQAQQDMQFFQSSLSAQQQRKVGNTQVFSAQYNKDASLLAAAQYPKDYAAISNDARKATEALALSKTTFNQLNTFK